jgi:hypothetical protein
MPSIEYTVASTHQTTVTRTATFNGQDIEAQVPAIVVECVSADGGMGHSFTFIGSEVSEAAGFFAPGETVTATFTKDDL